MINDEKLAHQKVIVFLTSSTIILIVVSIFLIKNNVSLHKDFESLYEAYQNNL